MNDHSLIRESVATPIKKPAGFSLREVNQFQIDEKSFEEKDGKHYLVVTLMREGPGNQRDNNFYRKSALESLTKLIMERPKNFFNHAKEIDDADRDVRDWASSVKESWVEGPEGSAVAKARVRVYDEWLWNRAKEAADEMALSVEGRGAGKTERIGEKNYNAIYEIGMLNGVHWVDYPGNAGMGVQVIESKGTIPEEEQMDFSKLMEGFKNLSEEEKAKFIAEHAPKGDDKSTRELVENLKRDFDTAKAAAESQAKALNEKVALLEKDKAEMSNKLEAHSLKEKERARETLVDKILEASRLKPEHKTATFRATLLSVREAQIDGKTLSESDQMAQLIKDREAICLSETAAPNAPATHANLSEADKNINFSKNIFGVDVSEVYKHADLVGAKNVIKA